MILKNRIIIVVMCTWYKYIKYRLGYIHICFFSYCLDILVFHIPPFLGSKPLQIRHKRKINMISYHTLMTLYKCSIMSFVMKRINVNYHLFKYLFLVSYLDFLEGDVVSFPFTQCISGSFTSKYLFLICLNGIS